MPTATKNKTSVLTRDHPSNEIEHSGTDIKSELWEGVIIVRITPYFLVVSAKSSEFLRKIKYGLGFSKESFFK